MNQSTLLEKFFPASKKEADPDEFFIPNTRKRRRLEEAAEKRQAKKGRRAFVRRELARERAASDLANLFAILDGEGANPRGKERAGAAIAARIDYLFLETLHADPDSEITEAQIEQQLRAVAATAKAKSA
jgi:3-deoxy-D-manno-octulosonic acid (KDO) 8-phosphate synthase